MHLIEKENGNLEFILDKNESQENITFHAKISQYSLVRLGASIFIYLKGDDKLLVHFNPFDNTQLICDPRGYDIAAEFGTKRFPVGDARLALEEKEAKNVKAITFPRDLQFPLKLSESERVYHKVATLNELLRPGSGSEFYDKLSLLFHRCADFTPGKMEEYYSSSGKKNADTLCRFNLESCEPKSNIVTDHVFIMDDSRNIIGTMSATICINNNRTVDIYFYDEVVDYLQLLTVDEKIRLDEILSNKSLTEEAQKAAMSKIIEPKRLELMEQLFIAARQKIHQTLQRLQPELSNKDYNDAIDKGKIRAFIRAAEGRVSSYVKLHCSPKNPGIQVIHGPPTSYAKMLDEHVKSWARNNLLKAIVRIQSPFFERTYYYNGWKYLDPATNSFRKMF